MTILLKNKNKVNKTRQTYFIQYYLTEEEKINSFIFNSTILKQK